MAQFYVDNNILRILYKISKDDYEELFMPVFSRNQFDGRTYSFRSSPYVVLEAIGIRPTFIKEIPVPKRNLERIKIFEKEERTEELRSEVEELLKHLFETYSVMIAGHQKLSEDHIQHRINETKNHSVTDNGEWLFKDTVLLHVDDLTGYRESLEQWFSLEKTLSQNFPKSIMRNVFAYLINTANAFFKDDRNNSFARLYYNIAFDLSFDILKKDKKVFEVRKLRYKELNLKEKKQKRKKRRYLKLVKLKNRLLSRKRSIVKVFEKSEYGKSRDNIDSEMIHLLCFGAWDNEKNKRVQIIAFSSDKIEVIVARLSLYKSLIKGGWMLRENGVPPALEGKFYHFDKSSNRFTHEIVVSRVPSFYGALDQGKDFKYIMESSVTTL